MASVVNRPNNRREIQFCGLDNKRRTLRLGKCSKRDAEAVCRHVEAILNAARSRSPVDAATAEWLGNIPDAMHQKLAAVGLVLPRESTEGAPTLGEFLKSFLDARRADYKPASIIAWGQVASRLVEFLGETCRLDAVTPAKAEEFRRWLIDRKLRPTTIHKRLQHARMFFEHARRRGMVDANPFEFVRHRPGDPSERRAYVPVSDALKVIDFASNSTWRLLIALSRFGGLRVPSEAFSLRWQNIDWETGRIVIPSPKTQHLAGRSSRTIPIFPALRPFLESAWDEAPDGAEYVIPEEYRRRAMGPGGWGNANLRTTFEKIVRRAGLEPWPRLWHSMRASCETDLARQFPLPVVAKWMGNTQAVAMRHYVDVTDADFERATRAQNPTQPLRETPRIEAHPGQPLVETQDFTAKGLTSLEAGGIEPPSCDGVTMASTRVVG